MPNGQTYEDWLEDKGLIKELKALLTHKYGGDSEVMWAANKLGETTYSLARKWALAEELEAAGADQDPEVRRAAQELLKPIEFGDNVTRWEDGNQRTQDTAEQQRALARELADKRRQDDTLQAYLDGVSHLLTDKDRPLHRAQSDDTLSNVVRARTLTVLPRLDGARRARVVQYLHENLA
jgi:hypothetical protein